MKIFFGRGTCPVSTNVCTVKLLFLSHYRMFCSVKPLNLAAAAVAGFLLHSHGNGLFSGCCSISRSSNAVGTSIRKIVIDDEFTAVVDSPPPPHHVVILFAHSISIDLNKTVCLSWENELIIIVLCCGTARLDWWSQQSNSSGINLRNDTSCWYQFIATWLPFQNIYTQHTNPV